MDSQTAGRVRCPGATWILLRLRIRGIPGLEPPARARHVRRRRFPPAHHHIIAVMPLKRIGLVALLLMLLTSQRSELSAQGKFLLTIDNIMRGPELYGYPPQDVRWSGDNQRIYFQWKQASDAIDKP